MQKTNDTIDVRFSVRASQNIQIRFYQKPSLEYPSVTVSKYFNIQTDRLTVNLYPKL